MLQPSPSAAPPQHTNRPKTDASVAAMGHAVQFS